MAKKKLKKLKVKKPTKEEVLISELKNKVDHLTESLRYQTDQNNRLTLNNERLNNAITAERELRQSEASHFVARLMEMNKTIESMTEIIRWKINPNTTNYPYGIPKTEKFTDKDGFPIGATKGGRPYGNNLCDPYFR